MASTFPQEYIDANISAPLLQTCIAFLVLETIFIGLMFTSRYLSRDQKANLSMMILMATGYIVCVGKITLGILTVEIGGAGRHLATLPESTIKNALKLNTALQVVCPLTTSLSKLGILCLFYDIFGRTSKRYRVVIKTTFIFVLCILIVQVILPFANCKPFSKSWTPNGPGKCAIPGLSLWRFVSIPNVITTFIMIAIPIPALYTLNISLPTRYGICLVFGVCTMGVVAAIMRFKSFLEVNSFADITYENVKPLSWTIAESGLYMMAGVMPTLRPLVRKVFKNVPLDRMFSASFRSSGSWGNKVKRVNVNIDKTLPEIPKNQKPFTDMSSKGTVIVMMDDDSLYSQEYRR